MRLSSSRSTAILHRPQQDFLLWDKAGTRPSLDLQFADRKDLVDATTGSNLVDFTRASSGTYVGSDGLIKTATTNEARFDHDPVTGESLGLLVEESRTNLLQRSEDFADSYWGSANVNGTITTNQAAAPDGTITANLYTENTDTSGRYFAKPISWASDTFYTVSIWAKQASGTRYLGLLLPNASFGSNCVVAFTLSGAGSYYISNSGTGTTANIQKFPNGWYRCSLTSQTTATSGASVQFRLSNSSTSGTGSYTGDGTSGLYLWGAQLEEGSFPTSYIPTTTSAVTRADDVASIEGANFSSWYRQDEGTVFAEINRNTSISRNLRVFSVTDGTTNNRAFDLRQDTSSLGYAFSVASGVIEVLQSVEFNSGSQNNKVAISQSLNNFGVSTNGGSVLADTSVTMPIVNQISIGSLNGASQFAGAIRRLVYWDQRLPNDTLETITQ